MKPNLRTCRVKVRVCRAAAWSLVPLGHTDVVTAALLYFRDRAVYFRAKAFHFRGKAKALQAEVDELRLQLLKANLHLARLRDEQAKLCRPGIDAGPHEKTDES